MIRCSWCLKDYFILHVVHICYKMALPWTLFYFQDLSFTYWGTGACLVNVIKFLRKSGTSCVACSIKLGSKRINICSDWFAIIWSLSCQLQCEAICTARLCRETSHSCVIQWHEFTGTTTSSMGRSGYCHTQAAPCWILCFHGTAARCRHCTCWVFLISSVYNFTKMFLNCECIKNL